MAVDRMNGNLLSQNLLVVASPCKIAVSYHDHLRMDLHCCGDCKKEFNSFEDFFIHKLLFEKYKMIIEPSARIPGLRLPKFIKLSDGAKEEKEKNACNNVKESTSPSSDETLIVADLAQAVASKVAIPTEIPTVEITSVEEDKITLLPSKSNTLVETNQELEVCIESDDNISVLSQTESLRIDESFPTKENQSSPNPDATVENNKQDCQLYCKQCDRYYKNRNGLRVHQETVHGSDRPYPCLVCDQAFKTKGSLVRHNRIHTGERPFRCHDCGRAFRDSGMLSRHIHNVHKNFNKKPRDLKVLIARISDTAL